VDQLPVLDLTALRHEPQGPAARRLIQELRQVCHEVGFCYVVGHGVDPGLEARVLGAAARFFDLPEADRLAIANTNTPYFRGYTRLGAEHTGGLPDWRDQIDIAPEREPVELGPDDPAWLRLRGPNQWPDSVPELRPVVLGWMDQMADLGRLVLGALARGLGQPADHFDPVVEPDPEVLVKIIRYPALPDPATGGRGLGLHQDSGLLSFILQDDVGGLQVERDGRLVAVEPRAGAYVLNLGEMLQVATDGYLRATRHQVVSPPPGRQRISVAYFFNPCLESTLEPVPLPADLAASTTGGQNQDPDDPVFATYGENWLKFRLRSHPDVAAIHHADLVAAHAQGPAGDRSGTGPPDGSG
jgi:isopenicillin N synthase-like dioxygenase